MRALTPEAILRAWETGRDQHPIDRALTLLLVDDPGETRAGLAELSLVERDARLLRLRARTLGSVLSVFTCCPTCGERLEFPVRAEELADPPPEGKAWEAEADGLVLRFRLPNSRDLAAAAGCRDAWAARRLLAERCVLEVAEGPLPEAAVGALAERMAEVAPQAEILFDLSCPACGGRWMEGLDIAAFFWTEISAEAKRILREVDALARIYHWSESEILAMSPTRRQSYLELVWE